MSLFLIFLALSLKKFWDDYHDILWNTQSFAVCLSTLILTEESLGYNVRLLGALLREIFFKASEAYGDGMLGRHIGCMVGMAVSGIATFGPGAVAFWAAAGASMAKGIQSESAARDALTKLKAEHYKIRTIANIR